MSHSGVPAHSLYFIASTFCQNIYVSIIYMAKCLDVLLMTVFLLVKLSCTFFFTLLPVAGVQYGCVLTSPHVDCFAWMW